VKNYSSRENAASRPNVRLRDVAILPAFMAEDFNIGEDENRTITASYVLSKKPGGFMASWRDNFADTTRYL
jgi:hypothetical protein